MKVFAVTCVERMGGGEWSLLDALAGLSGRGVDCELACADPVLAEKAVDAGVRSHRLRQPRGISGRRSRSSVVRRLARFVRLVPANFRLLRLIHQADPDVVLVSCRLDAIVWSLTIRTCRRPVAWVEHDLRPMDRTARLLTRGLFCLWVSESARAAHTGTVNGERPVHGQVVFSPVRSRLRPVSAKPAGSTPQIGILARIQSEKGHDLLLDSLGRIASTDWRLLVAGDDHVGSSEYRDELHEIAVLAGIADRIEWMGHTDDIQSFLDRVSVVACPSRTESFGRAALEAAMAGLPVVAFAVGGLGEIVVDESTGLLCPPEDTAAFASALERLVKNPALAARMGAAARERAIDQFSFEAAARNYEAALATAAGR